MINVTTNTKNAYKTSSNKTLTIVIGSRTFTNSSIDQESLSIDENLELKEYLQFTGCNSSRASFTLRGITENFKGSSVSISIQADNTESIPLFHGIVDEQKTIDYAMGKCDFVCYDSLYTAGQTDVAEWYKNTEFPTTIGALRASLFSYIGLSAVSATLVNDSIEVDRQYVPENLAALDVIKAICQINAVYGIINRDGLFEYRSLPTIPGATTYETVDYYKGIDYQHYSVKSIAKVIVRQSDDEVGATYGSDGNTYIVQGNMFTYNLGDTALQTIARNIFGNVYGKVYTPYSANNYGMPWVEVGDILKYSVYNPVTHLSTEMSFYVLSRSFKGIQAPMDNVSAKGQEYQTVFISSLNAQVETLKANVREVRSALDKAVIKHYQSVNETALTIGNDWVKVCDFLPFNHYATDVTDFVFEGSLKFTAETTETLNSADEYVITPCQMLVKYSLNGADLSYIPTDVYDDGTHTVALNYQFAGVTKNTATGVEVFAKALTGSVSVAIGNAIGYLWGQNLAERQIESISVTTMPETVSFVEGSELDLTGVEITGTFNDGTTADVTLLCTFNPADGDTLETVGEQTIEVTLGTLQTSFDVEVIALDFLRYVDYVEYSDYPARYVIQGLKVAEIEADGIHKLTIPTSYNGKQVWLL